MAKLTPEAVVAIVGRLPDDRIARIIETGASDNELMEAQQWVLSDENIEDQLQHQPNARVALLCQILEAERPPQEEP
jgi:hypothetical protein